MMPGRVLIIEDDPDIQGLVCEILREDGHELLTALRGGEGLELARSEQPDVVILDLNLPDLDGFEICARLKADDATKGIPVLMSTAQTDRESRLRGLELGANDYLLKPVDPGDVRLRVRNAIQSKRLLDLAEERFRKLQELEELRDNLLHMIVHDLKSPVGAVQMSAQLLQREFPLEAEAQFYVDRIAICSDRVLEMIGALLDLHRLESGHIRLLLSERDVAEVVATCLEDMASRLDAVHVDWQPPASPRLAVCDGEITRRVLVNLIDNAVRHVPRQGGRLTVRLNGKPDMVRVEVEDNGPGINSADHERIFEKFGQVGACERYGVGLGLAFCKLAIESHGGEIGVESQPGEGAMFWFTLPAAGATN